MDDWFAEIYYEVCKTYVGKEEKFYCTLYLLCKISSECDINVSYSFYCIQVDQRIMHRLLSIFNIKYRCCKWFFKGKFYSFFCLLN